MATAIDILRDGFERVHERVHGIVDGLDEDALTARVGPGANTVAWLVWHLLRVQDDHVADAAGTEQVWTSRGWAARFALPFDEAATGYGQSADEVAQVRGVPADDLLDYADDVRSATDAFLDRLGDDDLDRVVDDAWDPPVTLGVRLVSVIDDGAQHVGQAAFVMGLLGR